MRWGVVRGRLGRSCNPRSPSARQSGPSQAVRHRQGRHARKHVRTDLNDGVAWCPRDAEPAPGTACRIPHRLVCPGVDWSKPWSWLAAAREETDPAGAAPIQPATATQLW
ncbi:hypothetical protein FNV62_54580 [Streptomyces sp. RLB3-17]|uniref:DUF6083 domain-containing protein n=1 Tax=Streptomyces sp. RLB3-17 TaxID=2594455 RepID=UPI0011649F0C|nr:DUF6083 domain-containing protein [Streptomyces sp. RLB3-17]QDO45780.1 hypothetical protein FNV62_54580 [Streptomyces sp. RLB3-17]